MRQTSFFLNYQIYEGVPLMENKETFSLKISTYEEGSFQRESLSTLEKHEHK